MNITNIYLFINAVVLLVLFYQVNFRVYENMASSPNVEKTINKIYKADLESIRNLAEISKKLQKGGLTVPGDLRVKGKLEVDKDLSTKGKAYIKNNAVLGNHLEFSGSNKWIIYAPNDKRRTLYIAPRRSDNKNWNWSNQINLKNNGNLYVNNSIKWYKHKGKYLGSLAKNSNDGSNIYLKNNRDHKTTISMYAEYGNKNGRILLKNNEGHNTIDLWGYDGRIKGNKLDTPVMRFFRMNNIGDNKTTLIKDGKKRFHVNHWVVAIAGSEIDSRGGDMGGRIESFVFGHRGYWHYKGELERQHDNHGIQFIAIPRSMFSKVDYYAPHA
jgi:hypothetical protein